MPANKFYLDEQKTQELILSWRGRWKDTTVTLNGHVIGSFQNFDHLKQGSVFHLQDGSTIAMHYSTERYAPGIRVDFNGRPVKGSSGDPEVKLKGIFGIAAFIGILSFVLGAIGEFGDVEMLREMGIGWISMVAGTVVAGLGYCVWKFRSVAALIIIIILLASDIIRTLIASVAANGRIGFGGTFLKVFLILALVRGFGAIREIKDAEKIGDRNLANRNPFQ
jgi:hypothetical protein